MTVLEMVGDKTEENIIKVMKKRDDRRAIMSGAYIPEGAIIMLTDDAVKALRLLGNHVQAESRPMVVISNEDNNRYSPNLTIVPLTCQGSRKRPIPTHYRMKSKAFGTKEVTALGEAVMTIGKDKIQYYDRYNFNSRIVSKEDLRQIRRCVDIQLGGIEYGKIKKSNRRDK